MTRKQKKSLIRIIVSAFVCLGVYFIPVSGVWKLLLFCIPYLICGYDVILGAVRNIIHGNVFDEMFLMSVATIGAFILGEYLEAVGVMLFYQTGELFQSIAVGKSRKSISELMDIRPDKAVVLRENEEIEVSPEDVELGEIIVVKAGEKIPLDGEIVEGSSELDTSALTGESALTTVNTFDKVVSGSVACSGVLKIKVESVFAESTVSKILELVENASSKKAKAENFITKFARIYTPCVVISAIILGIVPPLFNGEWIEWITRALIFLMVSCPCAIVVSVPLSFFGGIGGASREGILVKGAGYFEQLAKVKTVVFDKTGTLTKGVFKVEAIHSEKINTALLLDIAAACESYSTHPVAESIVIAHNGHIDKSRISDVTELAGRGVSAIVDGKKYYVGNSQLMDMCGAKWHDCHLSGTIVHIANENDYLGHIVVNDVIKEDSPLAISELKKLGIEKTIMLSGDKKAVAEKVSNSIGLDMFEAELLPNQKVEKIEKLLMDKKALAFVGDGINDAPVLTRADVGIAMGALGSDAAIESADVVLMDDKPSKLPLAIRIARRTLKIVNQNIVFALAVKLVILVLSALGFTNMWMAIFGDVGVMILAVLNSLRTMKRIKK